MSDRFRNVLVTGILLPAGAVLLLASIGFIVGTFAQYVLTQVVISCLIGAALVMIVGYARVIMLAAGAMTAIGAYGSAVLMLQGGVHYLLTLPIVLMLGFISGLLLAVPATRFRGHHLAMVTLVFQFLVVIVIREWTSVTGGALGLRLPDIGFFGIAPGADLPWLLFVAAMCGAGIAVLGILLSGQFGKTLVALTDSEVAADAYGVSRARFQVAAFAISSAFLAFAGALLAPGVRILDPDSFGIGYSIVALGYPIVGGVNSIWGGLVGGTVLRALPEALRSFGQYQELWVALLAILVMVANPSGIIGIASRLLSVRPARKPDLARIRAEVDAPKLAPAPAEEASFPAIDVRGARKSYEGLVAVNDVNLRVELGAIHGLIGPNGAGKTTLFNAISGFTPPDAGTISILGRGVDAEPSRRRVERGVTRTFQNVAIFGQLSCLDNVILGLARNSVHSSIADSVAGIVGTRHLRRMIEEAQEALRRVGLEAFAEIRAGSLSLGNQRRLEIARAIVSRPRLILLDEPVSGVAQDEENEIAELLRQLNVENGITMLLIEHNIAFVRRLCRTMSVMAAGSIIAEGDPESVLKTSAVREQYFGELDVSAAT